MQQPTFLASSPTPSSIWSDPALLQRPPTRPLSSLSSLAGGMLQPMVLQPAWQREKRDFLAPKGTEPSLKWVASLARFKSPSPANGENAGRMYFISRHYPSYGHL